MRPVPGLSPHCSQSWSPGLGHTGCGGTWMKPAGNSVAVAPALALAPALAPGPDLALCQLSEKKGQWD